MATQRMNKLKSPSLLTESTLDESGEKNIKINIRRPLYLMSSLKLGPSNQQSKPLSNNSNNPNIADVAKFKKNLQMQVVKQSNNVGNQPCQQIRSSNRSNQKDIESFDESIDLRELMVTNETNNKKIAVIDHFKNMMGLQTWKKQQDKLQEDARVSNIIKLSRNKNNDEDKIQTQINLDQSEQIESQLEQNDKDKCKFAKKQMNFKDVVPRLKLSSKYEPIQPFRSDQYLRQNRSNSRIKLRDYLYMVGASSKRMQSKKTQSKGTNNFAQSPTLLSARSEQKLSLKSGKSIETKDQTSLKSKNESIKSKYNVSNWNMFEILKQQICSQIITAELNLQKVKAELQDVQASAEPTNQQLLILYNLRRQMKEYINNKIENTIESIRRQKKSNILQSIRKVPVTNINSFTKQN